MANSRARLIRILAYAIGAAGLVMLLLAARLFVGSSGFAYDFTAYDDAARRILAGQPLYPPGTAEAYNSGSYAGLYLYPPPPAVAMTPLALLDPQTGALAWFWLRVGLLVVAALLIPGSAMVRGSILAVASISFPVWYDLNLGNMSVVLFALSVLIWRFGGRPTEASTGASPVASIALAVAGVLRYPFGIVLIGLAAARRFRAAGWTVIAGLVIGAITVPVVGVQAWLDYARSITTLGDVSSGEHNLSLATTAMAFGLPGPALLWIGLQVAIALLATVYAARRRDSETAIVVSLAATILFFPFFHPHYLVQLLIPAAFLAKRGQWWGLVLPLLGWLPGEVMALAAIAGTLLPLTPSTFAALRQRGGEPIGAGAGFGTSPSRP